MKSTVLSLSVLLVVALFSVSAHATHPYELNFGADCDGWYINGLMSTDANTRYINVDYTVELSEGSTLVYSTMYSTTLDVADPVFDFSGMWDMELCGDYQVHIHFHFESNQGWGNRYFDTSFTCDCVEEGCTYTPGYWKNHPEAWPVSSLTIGGVTYPMDELMEIFDMPTKGDITIILFHHTVAAMLNVLSGSPGYIQDTIDAADAYFYDYPLFSKPAGEAKDEGEYIKDDLADYNEIECEEEEDDYELPLAGDGVPEIQKSGAQVESSWGSIKSKNK